MPLPPLVAAGLVAGAGSLMGSLINSGSQSSANSTNLQIAREQNQLNREMFDESLAYNERMQKEQNEYNSPVQQVQRYREAGINPALAMQQSGSSGNWENPLRAPDTQAAVGAHVEPVRYGDALSSLSSTILQYYQTRLLAEQTRKTSAEAEGLEGQNLFVVQNAMADLAQKISQTNVNNWQRQLFEQQYEYLSEVKDFMVSQQKGQADQLRVLNNKYYEETLKIRAERASIQLHDSLDIQMSKAQQAQIYAAIKEMYAQIDTLKVQAGVYSSQISLNKKQESLIDKQVENIASDTAKKIAEELNIKERTDHEKKINREIRRMVNANANRAEWSSIPILGSLMYPGAGMVPLEGLLK